MYYNVYGILGIFGLSLSVLSCLLGTWLDYRALRKLKVSLGFDNFYLVSTLRGIFAVTQSMELVSFCTSPTTLEDMVTRRQSLNMLSMKVSEFFYAFLMASINMCGLLVLLSIWLKLDAFSRLSESNTVAVGSLDSLRKYLTPSSMRFKIMVSAMAANFIIFTCISVSFSDTFWHASYWMCLIMYIQQLVIVAIDLPVMLDLIVVIFQVRNSSPLPFPSSQQDKNEVKRRSLILPLVNLFGVSLILAIMQVYGGITHVFSARHNLTMNMANDDPILDEKEPVWMYDPIQVFYSFMGFTFSAAFMLKHFETRIQGSQGSSHNNNSGRVEKKTNFPCNEDTPIAKSWPLDKN